VCGGSPLVVHRGQMRKLPLATVTLVCWIQRCLALLAAFFVVFNEQFSRELSSLAPQRPAPFKLPRGQGRGWGWQPGIIMVLQTWPALVAACARGRLCALVPVPGTRIWAGARVHAYSPLVTVVHRGQMRKLPLATVTLVCWSQRCLAKAVLLASSCP
jgi:hypothetical protein